MPVHSISSDLHMGNVERYVVSLARTMSKFRLLGLPLEEVVRAVTLTPVAALNLDRFGFGTLAVGKPANITVFSELEASVDVEDSEGEVRIANKWIKPHTVMVRGKKHNVTGTI